MCGVVEFKYLAPPERLGCTLYLRRDSYYVYFTVFFVSTIGINSFFLGTYLVLHYNFKQLLNVTVHVEALKRGALVITSMTAISYFIGYLPGTVVYVIVCISPDLLADLAFPYNLILDGVVRFMPRVTSCLLPFFLVSGNTMGRLTTAALVTSKSFKDKIPSKKIKSIGNRKT